jgi:membrane glycosyltransferase
MTGRRLAFRVLFLTITAAAVGLEVWASNDRNPDTEPWTDLIVRYVPMEVTALAIAGLSGWLAVHFARRYLRKRHR